MTLLDQVINLALRDHSAGLSLDCFCAFEEIISEHIYCLWLTFVSHLFYSKQMQNKEEQNGPWLGIICGKFR